MVEVERGEDMGLEIFVQGGGCYALDQSAGPVDAHLEGVSCGGGSGRVWGDGTP